MCRSVSRAFSAMILPLAVVPAAFGQSYEGESFDGIRLCASIRQPGVIFPEGTRIRVNIRYDLQGRHLVENGSGRIDLTGDLCFDLRSAAGTGTHSLRDVSEVEVSVSIDPSSSEHPAGKVRMAVSPSGVLGSPGRLDIFARASLDMIPGPEVPNPFPPAPIPLHAELSEGENRAPRIKVSMADQEVPEAPLVSAEDGASAAREAAAHAFGAL